MMSEKLTIKKVRNVVTAKVVGLGGSLSVNGQFIANFPSAEQAVQAAQRLREALK